MQLINYGYWEVMWLHSRNKEKTERLNATKYFTLLTETRGMAVVKQL
jgi:hypothetical protein